MLEQYSSSPSSKVHEFLLKTVHIASLSSLFRYLACPSGRDRLHLSKPCKESGAQAHPAPDVSNAEKTLPSPLQNVIFEFVPWGRVEFAVPFVIHLLMASPQSSGVTRCNRPTPALCRVTSGFIYRSSALALSLRRGLRRIVARVRERLGHLSHTTALWLDGV